MNWFNKNVKLFFTIFFCLEGYKSSESSMVVTFLLSENRVYMLPCLLCCLYDKDQLISVNSLRVKFTYNHRKMLTSVVSTAYPLEAFLKCKITMQYYI